MSTKGFLISSISLMAFSHHSLSADDLAKTVANLKSQLEAVTEKLNKLESEKSQKSIKKHHHRHHHKPTVIEVVSTEPSEKECIKPGYWKIPGTDTHMKIGGQIRFNAIYNANAFSGDASELPTLPLRTWDSEAARQGIFRMHARATRFNLETLTPTALGELKTFIEADFFGTNNFGGLSRASTSVNSYNLRLRQAYGKLGRWLAGQTVSTFSDLDSWGHWVEFNGPNSPIRRPMVRFENIINKNWTWWTAAEFSPTEYTNESGTRQEHSAFLGGGGGLGFRSFPDLIMHFRYAGSKGHLSLRGLIKEHAIKRQSSAPTADQPNLSSRLIGWGLGISGRLKTYDKNSIFAQWNFGRGLGSYLFEAAGQATALQGENFNIDGGAVRNSLRAEGTRFRAQYAYCVMMGYEHFWSEKWKSNIAYAHTQVKPSNFVRNPLSATGGGSGIAPVSTTFRHFLMNIIWSPIKQVDVGFEYAYYRREAKGNLHGLGNRFELGIRYYF